MLASQPDAKSHMAECILFKKENDFCMILCQPLAGQLLGGW